MIFQEQKNGNDYNYFLEDVMGEIEITSSCKLTPKQLDGVVMKIMSLGVKSGSIKIEKVGDVNYKYKKAKLWE